MADGRSVSPDSQDEPSQSEEPPRDSFDLNLKSRAKSALDCFGRGVIAWACKNKPLEGKGLLQT